MTRYIHHIKQLAGTVSNRLRRSLSILLLLMGTAGAWAQPVEITTADDIASDTKKLYLIQTLAFQSFYMVPQDNNTVTTNHIPGDYMLWYFLDAGTADNIQYYYIVNNSTGKYIYNHNGNSRGISLISSTDFANLSDENKEKCKFKFVEDNTNNTSGFYNIDVKASQRYYGLNKQNGSQANANPIRLTDNDYIHDTNSKWKFIRFNGTFTWPDPPFTPSTNLESHFYKILNQQDKSYYISNEGQQDYKVTLSNSETDRMVWSFSEAPADPSDHWFKYYYIINPSTGDRYMHYDGTAVNGNSQNTAVSVKEYDPEDEDRYQFAVIQAARGDGNGRVTCYVIIPKLLRDVLWSSNSLGPTGSFSDGAKMGIINGRSADNKAQWTFEPTDYSSVCSNPTVTFSSATGKVTITTTTTSPTIYYTIDGTEPSSDNGLVYSAPFDLTEQATVKAIVTRPGFTDSEVISYTIYKVATPTIQDNGQNAVTITTQTDGATIYYTTDGSVPTTSSAVYSVPLSENISGVTVKAIALKDGMIGSAVGTGTVTLDCANPLFSRNGDNLTISCPFPASGVTIYYTKNGGDPTSSSTPYTGAITVALGDVIKAMAIAPGYNNSPVVTKRIVEDLTPTDGKYLINSQSDFELFIDMAGTQDGATYHYILQTDVTAGAEITEPFSGVFDGGYHTISGLTAPLFASIDGGTVRNVALSNVSVNTSGNAGAVCRVADGEARIYNCGVLSGRVRGNSNVGGLVGLINQGASVRVVNCYNFASVSGGTTMAGIVGKNEGTVGDVRIALCMMYGDMPGGTSPVYAGNHTSNASNFNEYNYWRSNADLSYSVYNDQIAIDKDDYLTRFPFYRHILNSHRELAAYFLFGDYATDHVNEIGHWAVDESKAPYPIVENWQTGTKRTLDAAAGTTVNVSKGNGAPITSLDINVIIGGNTYTESLPITDMDDSGHDYTWGKVVLPFANEFEINTDYSKICTGWKITGITGGTEGNSFSNYDVSDRECTSKDLYSTTGFIFAQGGNYIVPYNVTAIEITANFANAFYLSDASYEVGYSGDNSGNNNSGYIGRTALGGNMPDTYHDRTVYHTLSSALNAMAVSGSTHDQAVVLVGNYHQDSEDVAGSSNKGLTIMSIDADNNQEPDYAWYSNNTQDRPYIPPTRFDFIALIPMGMSSRVNNSSFYPGIPIWKPRGWFEMTETSLAIMEQFELDSNNFNTSESDTRNYRCIINGGYFTQMVRSRKAACNKVKYYQIGGNAYIKEFYPGNHSKNNFANPLVPINVTGGEIEQCFMTGYGQGSATGTDIRFWCAGGKIGKFLGAYMENPSTAGVNMTARIDHARIGRFFGGGTSPNARITGNIDVTINNSTVDFYCGGPEFGDMSDGKTVTTRANNTTFGEYYGAGFGGTAITYTNDEDVSNLGLGSANNPTVTYPSNFFNSHFVGQRLKYKANYGMGSCYKFEFLFSSRGNNSVARFYTGYAKFSLATTGSVTNILDGCTVLTDFYGAGCQGKVNGTVTSTLTDCIVNGSAYGGGYKAENNEVEVYPDTPPSLSVFTRETALFSDFGKVTPTTFTWVQGTNSKKNTSEGNLLYTDTDVTMTELGNVTDAIAITINGHTTIGENVFGGGNESKSLSNTTVTLKGAATINGNVFGGGNRAVVGGSTDVNIEDEDEQ